MNTDDTERIDMEMENPAIKELTSRLDILDKKFEMLAALLSKLVDAGPWIVKEELYNAVSALEDGSREIQWHFDEVLEAIRR